MNDTNKALFNQLQLAGLGLLLTAAALILDLKPILVLGIFVFIYGLIRFFLFKTILKNGEKLDQK